MGKQHQTALILGEGPTEFYYIQSLKDNYKNINIKPDYPKHTNIKELEIKINEGIELGYNHIFCIIDMDTKDQEPELTQYAKLKNKYAKTIIDHKRGIHCTVEFFETHRCTELFFLYYFRYTSRIYSDQPALINDLQKSVPYSKTTDFFKKCKGLHNYFEGKGGNLDTAITNAQKSMREKQANGRKYTYSELGSLITKLKELQ